jgi:hypothetical protein
MGGLSGHCLYLGINQAPNLSATGANTRKHVSAVRRYSIVVEGMARHVVSLPDHAATWVYVYGMGADKSFEHHERRCERTRCIH